MLCFLVYMLDKLLSGVRLVLNSFLYQGLKFNLVKLGVGYIKKACVAIFCLMVLVLCSVVIVNCFVSLVGAQTISTITLMSDEDSAQQPYFFQPEGPTITITSEGSVVGTDLIERQGDVYTLTGDIFGSIKVEKDNIIIDGVGYAIREGGGIDLSKDLGFPMVCANVVVKNVRFCDNGRIFVSSYGNSFINNTFEGGGIEIRGNSVHDNGNLIKHNIFINCNHSAIFADLTGGTVVVENNFVNYNIIIGWYGWLEFDRNYWSDYEMLYPDAKEIGNTGIWDTPYTYDTAVSFGRSFVDSNPLVNPVADAGAPAVGEESKPVPTLPIVDDNPKSPLTMLIVVSIVAVVIMGTGLVVYFKRHK